MVEGIRLAAHIGIVNLWIEFDSQILVDMIKGLCNVPWSISYLFDDIRKLLPCFLNFTISHIYREGNTYADLFAKFAITQQTDTIFNCIEEVPRHIRGEWGSTRQGCST